MPPTFLIRRITSICMFYGVEWGIRIEIGERTDIMNAFRADFKLDIAVFPSTSVLGDEEYEGVQNNLFF